MQIVYFDNHVVVVGKPAGIPSQSDEEDSVESQVRLWAKEQFCKSGDAFVHALHRLDKPVSGLLLLAKTSKALERLHLSFRNRLMKKTYIALVEGVVSQETGSLEDYLVHEEFHSVVSDVKNPKAKCSKLSYKVLEKTPFCSLLEIDLETGRYHQIRCQLAHLGHPIVGDFKYGAKCIANKRRHIALHHQRMSFPHPVTKETLVFEIPPPREWKEWVQEFSVYFE